MPDSIQLQFSLTFNPSHNRSPDPYDFQYGHVAVQANDTKISLDGQSSGNPGYDPKSFEHDH